MLKAMAMLVAGGSLAVTAAAAEKVEIRFEAVVGGQPLACGQQYEGIGKTRSRISPRDFRFYVFNVRLVDEAGRETPVALEQDGKWQLDDVALLDFENGTGGCLNGTPEINTSVRGSAPAGNYRALKFTLGVPFNKNHQDLASQPSPLNLTALFWAWNSGHKFARLDYSSTGQPRGVAIHLGSTGCQPATTRTTIPTNCAEPNRAEVTIAGFEPAHGVVVADLAALLRDSDVDAKDAGCMSSPDDASCGPLFQHFGLPFQGKTPAKQDFFRLKGAGASGPASSAR